ncbi:MAG: hypothetical protein AAB074_15645 [Planctomycetota bacterium]
MRVSIAILAVLAFATAASAQERRTWDLRSLTDPRPEKRGPRIGFVVYEPPVGAAPETEGTGDSIALLLGQTVNAGAWDSGVDTLEYANGTLRVTAGPEVLQSIAAALELLEKRAARTIVVEMEMVELAPGVADGLAPGLLDEAAAAGLRAAAADKARGRVAHRLVARGGGGRYAVASSLRRKTYVRDFDIEIAQQSAIADPIMDELQEGAVLEMRPHFSAGEDLLHLELLIQTARLAELADFKLPAASGGRLELPRMDSTEIRTYVALQPGRTLLLAATDYRPFTPGWTTAVLLRARVEGASDAVAERAGNAEVFRAYSIGALLRLPWFDRRPPHLGLNDPPENGGGIRCGPGPDPTCLDLDELDERIKAGTGEETWSEDGCRYAIIGDDLVVHAPPEVQDKIRRTLTDLELRLGANLAAESWLLAFPESEWLARRDVLERAGGLPDALFGDILGLVQKGTARLVAQSSALGRTGSPFHSLRGRHADFVAEHDVEIAWGAKAWDPVIDSLNDGFLLHAGVLQATEGRLQVKLQSGLAEASMAEALETESETGGAVQTPTCEVVSLGCDAHLQDGRAFVASAVTRNGAKGREVWVYLVRARTLGAK